MLGESIVTTVVGRYCHDGSCAITGQNVLCYPDGDALLSEWIDGIRAREHTCYGMVHLAFALCALLHVGQVLIYFFLLLWGGELFYQLTLWCQYHERNAEHRICTRGEDGEALGAVCYLKLYLRTF